MVTARQNLFSFQVPLSPIPSETEDKRRNHVATITVAPITYIWQRSPAAIFQLSDTRSLRINEVDRNTGYSHMEQLESLKRQPQIATKHRDEVPGKSAASSNTANSIVADKAGRRVVIPSLSSVESNNQHDTINLCFVQGYTAKDMVPTGRYRSAINPLHPYVVERMDWPKSQPSIRQLDQQLVSSNQDWAWRQRGANAKPCHARTVFVDESVMKVRVSFDQNTRQTNDKPFAIEASTSTSDTKCEERSGRAKELKRRSVHFNKQRQSETRRARYIREDRKHGKTMRRAARNCRSSYASFVPKDQDGLVRGSIGTVHRRNSPERRGKFDKLTKCKRPSHGDMSVKQVFKLASPRRTSRLSCEHDNNMVSDNTAYTGKVSATFSKQRRAEKATGNVVMSQKKRSFPSQEVNPVALQAGMKRTHTRHLVCKSLSYRPNRFGEKQPVSRVLKVVSDLCQERGNGQDALHLTTKRVRQLIAAGKNMNSSLRSGKVSALSEARKKSHDQHDVQRMSKADCKVIDWIHASKRIQPTPYGIGNMKHDDVNTIRMALQVGCNNNAKRPERTGVYRDGSRADSIGHTNDFSQRKGKKSPGIASTSSKYGFRKIGVPKMSPFNEAFIKLRDMCIPRTADVGKPKTKSSRTRSIRAGGSTKAERIMYVDASIGSDVRSKTAKRQLYAKTNTPMELGTLKTNLKSNGTIRHRRHPVVSSGLHINNNCAKSRSKYAVSTVSNIARKTITGQTVCQKRLVTNGVTRKANTQCTKRKAAAMVSPTSNCRVINAPNSRKKGNNHTNWKDVLRHFTPSADYRKLRSVPDKLNSCNVARVNIKLARRKKQGTISDQCNATDRLPRRKKQGTISDQCHTTGRLSQRSTGKECQSFHHLPSNDSNTRIHATGSDLQQLVPAGAHARRCQAVSPLPRPPPPKMQKTESAHNKIYCVNMKKAEGQKISGPFDTRLPTFVRNSSTGQAGYKPIGTWSFWGGSVSQDLYANVSVLYICWMYAENSTFPNQFV